METSNTPERGKLKNNYNGKMITGLIIVIIGFAFLVDSVGFDIPNWVFSWPMWLIAFGLIIGFKSDFKNSASIILLSLGGIFLIGRIIPDLHLGRFFWPAAIIGLGIWLIMGKNREKRRAGDPALNFDWDKRVNPEPPAGPDAAPAAETSANSGSATESAKSAESGPFNYPETVSSVSAFGGIKKTILSKDFRGGSITNFFGGAEINLMNADIKGPVVLDITQIFGGVKIIVPANWQVKSDMAAIFGGIEDKRMVQAVVSADKILIIDGVSIFGGVDIRSY